MAHRRWATKTLREHITKGYTINRRQIAKNYDAFMTAVADIQSLLPDHVTLDPKQILELIKEFSATWVSLDAYDRETLEPIGATKKTVDLSSAELKAAIANLRAELIDKGEASDFFAHEQRPDGIEGIIGNVMQSFGGKPLYETVEEQAAHLLYFMVKNHPFTDGNKRCGAFAFVWRVRLVLAESWNAGSEEDQPDRAHRAHASYRRKCSRKERPDGGSDHTPSEIERARASALGPKIGRPSNDELLRGAVGCQFGLTRNGGRQILSDGTLFGL